jgi:hypothetical protein
MITDPALCKSKNYRKFYRDCYDRFLLIFGSIFGFLGVKIKSLGLYVVLMGLSASVFNYWDVKVGMVYLLLSWFLKKFYLEDWNSYIA